MQMITVSVRYFGNGHAMTVEDYSFIGVPRIGDSIAIRGNSNDCLRVTDVIWASDEDFSTEIPRVTILAEMETS